MYCIDCSKMIDKISQTVGTKINAEYIYVDVDAYYIPYRAETVTEPAEGGFAEDFIVSFMGKDITVLFPDIEKNDIIQELVNEHRD